MQNIRISQAFPIPPDELFSVLHDHRQFCRIVGASLKSVTPNAQGEQNGVGSVRTLTILPGVTFDETTSCLEHPLRIEYRVTRASPVKDHLGVMAITPENGGARLEYHIRFAPRWPVPGLAALLTLAIRRPIERGLENYAKQRQAKQRQAKQRQA